MSALTVSIRLLGPFALTASDCEVVLPRKAQALLALLVLADGRQLRRETVADMLWPACGPEQALQSLRQCLWRIRKQSGLDLIEAAREFVSICSGEFNIDVLTFLSLAGSDARQDLAICADLYRGELLGTMSSISSPFEEWLAVERERLAGCAASVLRRLGEAHAAAGDIDAAVAAGRRLVALDDLNEDAHRLTMRILGQAGRRAEALRQFELCQKILRRELNLEPDAETWSLAKRLREVPRIATAPLATQESDTVAVRPPPAQQSVERRQVTIMSCKFDGLARLASELEPEELGTVTASFRDPCGEVVRRFGGVIAHDSGDGCLAVFGYPQAHEHDGESAVRAGLAIVEAVEANGGCDRGVHARIGIATGSAVVGDLTVEGTGQPYSVVGETRNLAGALEAGAEPNAVVIAAGTHRLVGNLFEYINLGTVEVKGLTEAVPAWQVLHPSAVASRFEALRGSALSQLVGRNEEIDLLLRRWARAKAGDGQTILISGEPGIGKSRLTIAMEERLHAEPYIRLCYFCSPYHQDSALYPFVDQLGRAAGFAHDNPPELRLEKLKGLLARAVATDEDVALLADLLSLPASDLPSLTPQRKKERTLSALIRHLEGLARQQPLVVIFEDAHWIDPTSRELLDLIIERVRSLPVLLIVTFRPEFQSPWIGQPQVSMLTLNRLDRRDRTALAMQIAGGKVLPEEVVAQIVDRTDGVPLFVEEVTKSVLESGLLREEGDRYVLDGVLPPLGIPTTLHASLLARLDRLASVRQVAQTGSAIGREFSYEVLRAVSHLAEDELQAALDRLVASELVFQRGAPPDSVYAFKHALVQDAAHGSLLRSSRQQLHAQIAEALETHSPQLMDTQPELYASHYADAGLVEKSVACWGKAGRKSAARSAMAEAASQFQKGLDQLALLPDNPERQRQELELRSAVAAALIVARGFPAPEPGQAYARARALWERLGSPADFLQIPYGQSVYHINRGEFDLAQRLAEDLLRLSRQRNDSTGLVLGHDAAGRNLMFAGSFAPSRSHLEEALALYDPISHGSVVDQVGIHPQVRSQAHLGIVLCCLGFPDQAVARSGAAIAEARRLAHPPSMSLSLALGAVPLSLVRDYAALNERSDQIIAVATEQGFPYWRLAGIVYRGWATVKNRDVAEGISLLRGGLTAYRTTGAESWVPYFISLLARACEIAGQLEEAVSLSDEALQIVERTGESWLEAELYRHKGQLLLQQGHTEAAGELYRKALRIAEQQGAKLWELRAAVSLARLWRDQGNRAEARDLLAPICEWYTEGFNTRDLKEAKALLDQLS